MARWPDVPAVYGWLRLDRRGNWYLIDRGQPDFDEARHGQGSLIRNQGIVDFIARNYQADRDGAWYWQNGPQRAYANLDIAPLVLRVFNQAQRQLLVSHCGESIRQILRVMQSPTGELLVASELGTGVVHDLDLGALQLEFDAHDQPCRWVLNDQVFAISADPLELNALLAGFQRKPGPR